MYELFVTILVFVGVMCVAAVLFGGWIIVLVLRLIGRTVGAIGGDIAETLSGERVQGAVLPEGWCLPSNHGGHQRMSGLLERRLRFFRAAASGENDPKRLLRLIDIPG